MIIRYHKDEYEKKCLISDVVHVEASPDCTNYKDTLCHGIRYTQIKGSEVNFYVVKYIGKAEILNDEGVLLEVYEGAL